MNKITNFIFFLLCCFLLAQEKALVKLKSGDAIRAKITKKTRKNIFLLFNQQPLKISRNLVEKITHNKDLKIDYQKSTKKK